MMPCRWRTGSGTSATMSSGNARPSARTTGASRAALSWWVAGSMGSPARFSECSMVSAARAALVGSWGHLYPHDGKPGPAVGFLQECSMVGILAQGN